MKRLMCLLVALMVAPAMAGVTISVVDNGDLTADIVVVADGDDADANGSLIAGIALDVSVDAGQILEVSNYKITGESVVGDKGYGIFLGTITFTGDDPVMIEDTGTPVAPADAPDNPPQLPGPACVLEFGALYDQAVPEAAPEATTVLCKIAVSEACNMTLAANSTRGGVVRIGGGAVAANFVGGPITGSTYVRQYVGPDQAEYDKYIAAGWTEQQMDAAWARPYQCVGDIMNNTEVFMQNYRVYISDLNELLTNWKKKIDDPTLNPAADVAHNQEVFMQNYRVYISDLNKMLENWKKKDAELDGNCNVAP